MKKDIEIGPVEGLEQEVPTNEQIFAAYGEYREAVRAETELVNTLATSHYPDPAAGEANRLDMTLARLRTEARDAHYEDLRRRKEGAWRKTFERLQLSFAFIVAVNAAVQAWTAWTTHHSSGAGNPLPSQESHHAP